MSPERWARVEALFHEALLRPRPDRERMLEAAGRDDPALAGEVASLLAAHSRAGPVGRLDAPPTALPTTGSIGPYRLLGPLGHGGMGMVYLAERAGPDFTQRVALKLIRAGFADSALEARLRTERRILARLEHPGIARFIDGGTTEAGQSYFAMEYVEGSTLLEHCRECHLDLPARLRLFLEVCDALHYAHQQLVVHGDLKPGNILVTPAGRARLLDFGIAELLEDQDEASRDGTAGWLTPAYASPEQMRGERVTTLTDVYALGVILYELLAGRSPYGPDPPPPDELQAAVLEKAPPPPSRAVSDRRQARRLAGDLDAVTLKALAKAPEERYASVDQFAADLRRHLEGRPVRARADRPGYRALKFVRRHRIAVAAGALTTLSLLAALAVTAWQAAVARGARDRADEARRRSDEVTAYLIDLFAGSDPQRATGDTLAARALLSRGLAQIDALSAQPAIQARMREALGLILVNLGQYARARELLEQALAQRRELYGDRHPEVAKSFKALAKVLRWQAEYGYADTVLRRALAVERASLDAGDPVLAQTLTDLAFIQPYLGRLDETVALYHEALELRRRSLGEDHPLVAASMVTAASALRRKGLYDSAEVMFRAGLSQLRRVLGPDHPEVAITGFHLADFLGQIRQRSEEAERLYRAGVVAIRRGQGETHLSQVHGLGNLADLLSGQGRHAEAEALYRESLEIQERQLGPEHPATLLATDALAGAIQAQGRVREATELRRRTLVRWKRALGPEHPLIAGALAALADAEASLGDAGAAERLAREALAMRERLQPGTVLVGLAQAQVAGFLARRQRFPEAERLYLHALDLLRSHVAPEHADVRRIAAALADLYSNWNRPADAARIRGAAEGPP